VAEIDGSCQEIGCPVNRGVLECFRRHDQPIHCDAFNPDPAAELNPAVAVAAESSARADDPTDQTADPHPADEVAATPEAPPTERSVQTTTHFAQLLEGLPTTDGRASSPGTVPDFERLKPPIGPRNQLEFADRSVPLRSMSTLDAGAAKLLMADHATRLVLPIGTVGSGKTTLLAALFEQFHDGPVRNWKFAGSQTLLGFLQRSYYASMASGRSEPITYRTRLDAVEAPWLHLTLANDVGRRCMLIADISGEHFHELAAGGGVGEALPILQRADHVLHLLDCSLFIELRDRQRAMTRFCALIRRMVEKELFAPRARHTIALTKCDTVEKAVEEGILRSLAPALELLNGPSVIRTAARPKPGVEKFGVEETLEDLLATTHPSAWLADGPVADVPRPVRRLGDAVAHLCAVRLAEVSEE